MECTFYKCCLLCRKIIFINSGVRRSFRNEHCMVVCVLLLSTISSCGAKVILEASDVAINIQDESYNTVRPSNSKTTTNKHEHVDILQATTLPLVMPISTENESSNLPHKREENDPVDSKQHDDIPCEKQRHDRLSLSQFRDFSKAGAGIWIGLTIVSIIIILVVIGAFMQFCSVDHLDHLFICSHAPVGCQQSDNLRNTGTYENSSSSSLDSHNCDLSVLESDNPLYNELEKDGEPVCRLAFENFPADSDLTINEISQTKESDLSSHIHESAESSVSKLSFPPSYQEVVLGFTNLIYSNMNDDAVLPPTYTETDSHTKLQEHI